MEPDPNLIPGGVSGNNQDAQIHPKKDGGDNRHQHPAKIPIEDFIKWVMPAVRVIAFLALVEAVALFLEHFADVFHGVIVELVNWFSLCLQLLIVAVPVAKLVDKLGKSRKFVWIPYGLICLVMLLGILPKNKPEPTPIMVSITTIVETGNITNARTPAYIVRSGATNKPLNCIFWFVHTGRIGSGIPPVVGMVKTPINVLAYFRITNLRDVPLEANSYFIEFKTDNGIWTECHSVDTRNGFVCDTMMNGDTNSGIVKFDTNNLNSVIENAIQPHSTVQGWMFFYMPNPEEFANQKRFHIKDITGEDFSADIKRDIGENFGVNVQERETMQYTKDRLNISQFPIGF